MFSFNSPFGMCPSVTGLVFIKRSTSVDHSQSQLSIEKGAIDPFATSKEGTYYYEIFRELAKSHGFEMDRRIGDAPKELIDEILWGTKGKELSFIFDSHFSGTKRYKGPFEGVVKNLTRRSQQTFSEAMKEKIDDYMIEKTCSRCHGNRLKDEVLAIRIDGLNIIEVTNQSINKLVEWFDKLEFEKSKQMIAAEILRDQNSSEFLKTLDWSMTLSRSGTLSGGESQRIRLATQIGSSLVGVIYVLDEPSIGLPTGQREIIKIFT